MTLPLETPRLLLRELGAEDWRTLQELVSKPPVRQHLGWDLPSVARTKAFLRRAAALAGLVPRPGFALGVELKGRGLIGTAEVHTRDPQGRAGEVRVLLDPSAWGRGLGTEALRALLDLGFRELRLHRLWGTARPGDGRALRALEKAGLHFEGLLQKDQWMGREWVDSYLFALTEDEWDRGPRL